MAELDKEVNCQRSRTVIVDDLDGSEEAETIRYSLDNNTYEIDLSSANAEKLRDFLKDYIEHSRIVEPDAAPGRMTGVALAEAVPQDDPSKSWQTSESGQRRRTIRSPTVAGSSRASSTSTTRSTEASPGVWPTFSEEPDWPLLMC